MQAKQLSNGKLLLTIKKALANIPDKYNLPMQVDAVRNMTPEQAKDFRNRVDQTIPELNLPSNDPKWNYLIQPTINAVPAAGRSLAKLPADRSPLEFGQDALNVASGALVGANLLHAGVAGASAVAGSPLVNNEVGGARFLQSDTPGSPVNTNPSSYVNPKAVANPTIGTLQQMTQAPDLTAYEQALNTMNVPKMLELAARHPDDARFLVHQTLGLLGR